MSHFNVAVFTDGRRTVEELLAPYDENIRVKPYIAQTRAQIIQEAKERAERVRASGKVASELNSYEAKLLGCKTDEEFYQAEYDSDETYDADGNLMTTYNPVSKWDWYEIGGRWSRAYDEYGIDPAGTKVGDIKQLYSVKKRNDAIRFWELYVEGQEPVTEYERGLIKWEFYRPKYYLERYKDKETYAKCKSSIGAFAVVLPDGTWREVGKMGWFGISGESHDEALEWELNFIDRFIKSANPDWVMTVIDCHI